MQATFFEERGKIHVPHPGRGVQADSSRRSQASGIFEFDGYDATYDYVYKPSLVEKISSHRSVDATELILSQRETIFGNSTSYRATYRTLEPKMDLVFQKELSETSEGMLEMSDTYIKTLQRQLPELISFCASPIDQMLWERPSNMQITESRKAENDAVDVDLFSLLRSFLGYAATPPVFGQAFTDLSETLFEDLFAFNAGMEQLSMGLPRWVPMIGTTRAHLARRRLLQMIAKFQAALDRDVLEGDPGAEWIELDDVSTLVRERNRLYRESDLSSSQRAGSELALLWE
jgi:hypothetical protein